MTQGLNKHAQSETVYMDTQGEPEELIHINKISNKVRPQHGHNQNEKKGTNNDWELKSA